MKRIISTVLSLMLLLNLGLTASAATMDSQTEVRVTALSQLELLFGDGNGFNLDKQITRSEAIAFIVRMLGKEDELKANSQKYNVSSFTDVSINKWYTPYIAYGSQNKIISGFDDSTFRPNAYVSEKAFLTLLLGALNYTPNTDFTWQTVYKKSYEAGLVKDSSYNQRVIDNTNYLRGDVTDTLYTALLLEKKGSNDTLIESLINAGLVNQDLAVDLNLIEDVDVSAISSIDVVDSTSLKLVLNESLVSLTNDQVRIYPTNEPSQLISTTISNSEGLSYTIHTTSALSNGNYTIELNNVIDQAGFKTSTIQQNFVVNIPTEIISDFFKISKIEVVSKNVINVRYTQPINLNAELPLYYEILLNNASYLKGDFSNMSIKLLGGTNNVVTLHSKNKVFTPGENFQLSVSGSLTNIYGAALNNGSGDKQSFASKAIENEAITVKSVYLLDNKTIELEFNKDVDLATSQNIANYSLTASNGIPRSIIGAVLSSEMNKGYKYVRLSVIGTFDSSLNYELTVHDVKDSLSMTTLSSTKYVLNGAAVDKTDLKIVNTTAENKGTLLVYLDRPLNRTDAVNTGLFSILGITDGAYSAIPTSIHYDYNENPYRIKVYLPIGKELIANNQYKLQVLNVVRDDLGNSSIANSTYDFVGSSEENVKPIMYEAKIIANNLIKVMFTEGISSLSPTNLVNNYVLAYKEGAVDKTKVPTNATLINPTTLILSFDSLSFTTNYTVKFTAISDYPNLFTRTAVDGLVELGVVVGK